jgi:hypothetical protein
MLIFNYIQFVKLYQIIKLSIKSKYLNLFYIKFKKKFKNYYLPFFNYLYHHYRH